MSQNLFLEQHRSAGQGRSEQIIPTMSMSSSPLRGEPRWYAVYSRSRHEKQVEAYLKQQRLHTFLPLRRCWSTRQDRRAIIEVPAMPGYLFVRCSLAPETRALIKRHSSVLHLIESAGRPAPIPEHQIESLRIALENAFNAEGHAFLKAGDRVRVARGPLLGAEGFLVRVDDKRHRLVIGVEYVNQALSIEVDARDVERVE